MAKPQESTNTDSNVSDKADAPKKAPERGGVVESTFAEKWEPQINDTLSGRYLGSETAENGRDGSFQAYQLTADDGKRMSMAGAHLDSILPQVPKGTYVWITYTGTRKVGRNDMKLYHVEIEKGVQLIPVLK